VEGWLESHRQRLLCAHLLDTRTDAARLRRWFDLTGLQRHIKVLGIFCRLGYRDGKMQYLRDLPRVWRYVVSVARAYNDLAPRADLLERARGDRDITQPREDITA
jgi:aminoglycoside/choline kinase family phosphotransferase